ncbi:MAG TPA: hypothetical protein IAD34_09480 [Candidatus Scatovicinus merdipullorum]|nr:hypothetical protein [Candidatus Scatovicinus merdipullorum]
MEKIYKSEGMSSGAYKVQMVFSIIIGIIGAICLFTGIQKRSFIDHLVSGSNPEQQTLTLIIGILLIIGAILQIATTFSMNKSRLYVYSDHIEGVSSSKLVPFSKNFDLKYNQITDIKYVSRGGNRYIYLYANGVKYTVPINGNVQEAYNAVHKQRQISNYK